MRKCPACAYEGNDFQVLYTQPLMYRGPRCEKEVGDPRDGSGFRVLRGMDGVRARPEMYSEEEKKAIAEAEKELGKRIDKALQGSCPSCHGDPNVDCSCQPWK